MALNFSFFACSIHWKMNKADLVEKVADGASITKSQANKTIDCLTAALIKTLNKGGRVTIVGFGTFLVSSRLARNGRNPQTGTTIKIKSTKVARFKAGKSFTEAINNKS